MEIISDNNSGWWKLRTLDITSQTVWYVVMCANFMLQTTLERHVNSHFSQSEAGNGSTGARRSLESASSKLFRRNGKKLRYRRQPWSGRAVCSGSHHQLLSWSHIGGWMVVQWHSGTYRRLNGDAVTQWKGPFSLYFDLFKVFLNFYWYGHLCVASSIILDMCLGALNLNLRMTLTVMRFAYFTSLSSS